MPAPQIDVHELAELRAQGAAILDVRTPDEWEDERVPGVPLIPLADLVEQVDDVPDGEPVYVICATGSRSDRAADYLRSIGRDAINVAGGTKAWAAAGYPTDSGPA